MANGYATIEGEGYQEGNLKLVLHYFRERNYKVISEAKKIALKKYNELRCEVCNFSFYEHYGDRGINFIEGHHLKPISEMEENQITKPEDICLICSNCHRMIHSEKPWLTIEELKLMYKD